MNMIIIRVLCKFKPLTALIDESTRWCSQLHCCFYELLKEDDNKDKRNVETTKMNRPICRKISGLNVVRVCINSAFVNKTHSIFV